jgi:hypothetical protein
MSRHHPLRLAGAALALGFATTAAASPSAVQSEAQEAFYPRARAVIQAYYPTPQDPSFFAWAERIVLWNTLQILALQGILDISALVATCAGSDASDSSGLATCQDEVASLALRSQVLALEEACRFDLSAGERADCLFAFFQELATLEQVLHPRFQFFLQAQSDLWRVYANHGRPGVMRFRAIPELRRLAELDTILLFVSYVRVKALEEQIALLQRIESELAGQAWANEVPRGELFLVAAQMQRDWARRELEWLWTYQAYSLASAGWAEAFRGWLELTRNGRISSAPLQLPQLHRRAVLPRPTEIPAASAPTAALRRLPSAQPHHSGQDTVRRGLYLVLAKDSVVVKDRGSTLWVQGGRPISFRPYPPPVGQEQSALELPPVEPPPLPPVKPPPLPPVGPTLPPDDSGASAVLDFLDASYWAERLSDALDSWPRQRAWPLELADKWALGMRALAAGLDAAELSEAIVRQDMVGAHVAALQLVGGPAGALAMELTGFDEKLRTLERAGYSVPEVMDYAVEVAEDIVSPFSFGKPAPYSQMIAGHGVQESALDTEIRNYEQHLREAVEDERRRTSLKRKASR